MQEKEIKKDIDLKNSEGIRYLLEIGLKEVSNRTFIHEGELERFLSGNFENINKTKAMGFIQILQREFHIDLSDLKQKYLSYIQEHQDEPKVNNSLILEEVKNEERTKTFFTIFFLLLAIGAIGYLIKKYDLLNFDKPINVDTAQVVQKSDTQNQKIDLDKIVLDEPKEKKSQEKITNSKQENELDLNKVLEENKNSIDKTKDKQGQVPKDSTNEENSLDLSKLNSQLADDTISNSEQNTTSQDQNSSDTKAVTNELYIIPDSKVWIGTIDLDTFKKHDFLTPRGQRVDIDTSKNQLIMIGHRFVKMYFNGEIVKFKRRGPIRFKYIDGNLTEIDRREFNKLAKGRQW